MANQPLLLNGPLTLPSSVK